MKHAREDYNRIQDPDGLIPEDEPVFLLRAQDVVSVQTVETWARLAEESGADPDIVHRARRHANEMRKWHNKKIPDLPKNKD